MSDDDTAARIDPRFDPAFQRGFEGAVTTTRRRALPGVPPVLPAQQQIVPPPVSPPAPAAVPAPAPTTVADDEAVEELAARGMNPFVVGLWVVAAVLVLVGGYLAQWVRTTFLTDSVSTNVDYVTIEIVKYGAPLLIALGLATAIGLLFLHAVAWRKRH